MAGPWEDYQDVTPKAAVTNSGPWSDYAQPTAPAEKRNYSAGDAALSFVSNLPEATIKLGGDVVKMVTNPIDTAKGMGTLISGAVGSVMPDWMNTVDEKIYNALPKQLQDTFKTLGFDPEGAKKAVAVAKAVGGQYAEKYGSYEGFKRGLAEDPANTLLDLSMLFSGGASAAAKGGQLATKAAAATAETAPRVSAALAKVGEVAPKVASGAAAIGKYSNPLLPATAALGAGIKYGAIGAGKLTDLVKGASPALRAKQILEESLTGGVDTVGKTADEIALARQAALDEAKATLSAAPEGQTAAQAIAGNEAIQARPFMAASEMAKETRPDILIPQAEATAAATQAELAGMAGGKTLTEVEQAAKNAKDALNKTTSPMREDAFKAARDTNESLAGWKAQAEAGAEAAAKGVEDVRHFNKLSDVASDAATLKVVKLGIPTGLARHTYAGELAGKAKEVLSKAADESLSAGEKSRYAEFQLNAAKEAGYAPITVDSIVQKITKMKNDPKIGISDINHAALSNVANKLTEWKNKVTGSIDPSALYEIRKTAITDAIEKINPGLDKASVKNRASQVLSELNPIIDSALDAAAGDNRFSKYLAEHSAGMAKIDQTKSIGKMAKMLADNPKKFLDIVNGNNPKAVEKLFGPGKFDIAKAMGDHYAKLKQIGNAEELNAKVVRQANEGASALADIIKKHQFAGKIPFMGFNPKLNFANGAMGELQKLMNVKTRKIIADGMRSGKSANEILSLLPTVERIKLLKIIANSPKMLKDSSIPTVPIYKASSEISNANPQPEEQ